MDIHYFILFCLALSVGLFVLARSRRLNRAERVIKDDGDAIIVRTMPLDRLMKSSGTRIPKESIVRVQWTQDYLSLFNHHDHAYDVYLLGRAKHEAVAYARHLLPDAEYIEISH